MTAQAERNREIVLQRRAGWSLRQIGRAWGLTGPRVHQILVRHGQETGEWLVSTKSKPEPAEVGA